MSCKLCEFFDKTKENNEKIAVVNNAILHESKYSDIEALLVDFKNDNKLRTYALLYHFI